ncbi:protein-lysine N-methyltransferase EEF2KMT-like isoform X2 [Tubulanus polymorphus]|uniref:protein-lysine N-methyltransferase EEF2KMT-like isoform X2 n=1 Tax=Tubulanus polymorphus TaxID=672921 RepID=UPI003DA1DA84
MNRTDLSVDSVSLRFLAGTPLNEWCEGCLKCQDIDSQLELLKRTVKHDLARRFPPSVKYRTAFLKLIINQLERNCAEVCEELYEMYTEILSESSTHPEYGSKIYFLAPKIDDFVTIYESSQLVSDGTTGLRTWAAAFYLAEYLLENESSIMGRNVLELGCGLGFTGLAVCRSLNPGSYTFSDCHESVMKRLARNVETNTDRWSMSNSSCCRLRTVSLANRRRNKTDTQTTDIVTELIDWSREESMDKLKDIDIDVILAADVVYDKTIIPSLVSTLDHLLTGNSSRVAYVSSTVRDSTTQQAFKHQLESSGLVFSVMTPPPHETFIYDRTSIEIIRIHKNIVTNNT